MTQHNHHHHHQRNGQHHRHHSYGNSPSSNSHREYLLRRQQELADELDELLAWEQDPGRRCPDSTASRAAVERAKGYRVHQRDPGRRAHRSFAELPL